MPKGGEPHKGMIFESPAPCAHPLFGKVRSMDVQLHYIINILDLSNVALVHGSSLAKLMALVWVSRNRRGRSQIWGYWGGGGSPPNLDITTGVPRDPLV